MAGFFIDQTQIGKRWVKALGMSGHAQWVAAPLILVAGFDAFGNTVRSNALPTRFFEMRRAKS